VKTFFEDMAKAIEGVTLLWAGDDAEVTPEDWHGVCSMFLAQAATAAIGTIDRKSFMRAARLAYVNANKAVTSLDQQYRNDQRALGRGLLNSILGGPLDDDLDPGLPAKEDK
jgi:hypothetical protein